MADSIFLNYKFRCSSLGHLMTNLVTADDIKKIDDEIKVYLLEKANGINANGNKVKWTDNKQIALDKLLAKKNNPDELPVGAKSYLDTLFNEEYYDRRRDLNNKYLTKGLVVEQDGLALIGLLDDKFYIKNTERLSNEYIKGEPDNRQDDIKDIKASWDKETFDGAKLTTLYKYQIKGYCWLDNKTKGELCYCLLNNPLNQIIEAIKSIYYRLGTPDDDNEDFIEAKQSVERNMIFDKQTFLDMQDRDGNYLNRNYDFENRDWKYDIHPINRVKRFDVELYPGDIKDIISRVLLSREYLMEKELVELNKIADYERRRN
jgi:hypothetical protein